MWLFVASFQPTTTKKKKENSFTGIYINSAFPCPLHLDTNAIN